MRLSALLLAAMLVALIALSYRMYRLENYMLPRNQPSLGVPRPVTPRDGLSNGEQARIALFRKTWQSVVHITNISLRTDPFRMNVLEVPQGTGSGVVWDVHGHLVTNFHVVRGSNELRVTFADHSTLPARLVGQSERNDLAVVRVSGLPKSVTPLALGTSHDLVVGQDVIAIGSPFGLDYTLSTGVISGLGRDIPGQGDLPIEGGIQTDAAINPGNSGGPLIDSAGRLIGINTAILSPSGASAGIGFAIPVDTVARVVPDLIAYGREVRPVIGVELANDAVSARLGLPGVLVLRVVENSPAAQAGIVPTQRQALSGEILLGDVITHVDGEELHSASDLYLKLEKRRPGDTVKVSLLRQGVSHTLSVVLGKNVG
jgi:S1-C subfamily serine protease